jgi:hypothetical protein
LLYTELKPTELEDGTTIYGVVTKTRNVLGWIQHLPSGWRRYGYEDDAPIVPTVDEAICDLIEYDSHEQDTADWP